MHHFSTLLHIVLYDTCFKRPFYSCVLIVAKPLIWSQAEGDLDVLETSIQVA